jgi:general stress protein 26
MAKRAKRMHEKKADMMHINFKELETEIIDALAKNKVWILATASGGRVTARSVSIVNEGLRCYFQTDTVFDKYQHIIANPNVALCFGNIQIEGKAKVRGPVLAPKNQNIAGLYKQAHHRSYLRYSHLKNEVFIEIQPSLVTLWKYIDDKPCRDFLFIAEGIATREYYHPE